MKKDLRGTWKQALSSFFLPIFIILVIRWALFEPFVIPSGSMIPSLLIFDHILVNKTSFGLQWPFIKKSMVQWRQPERGDIIVFRFPENEEVFFVKRVIGLPGDKVQVKDGVVILNDKPLELKEDSEPDDDNEFTYFKELNHRVRYLSKADTNYGPVTVKEKQFFVMGDNRNQSHDSRFWGTVPADNIVGKASLIWLSCDKTLVTAKFLCDPSTIRWNRLLKGI